MQVGIGTETRLSITCDGINDTDFEAVTSATVEIWRGKTLVGKMFGDINRAEKIVNCRLAEYGKNVGDYKILCVLNFKDGGFIKAKKSSQLQIVDGL